MSQLLGILHGREETFPPALLGEVNGRQAEIHGESITLSSVEALDRSPYRLLVDRISNRVPYYRSFIRQQQLLGVSILPSPELGELDRVGLAQLALQAKVQALPTILLPHHSHPAGVSGDDLSNLAYPMPWETYLRQMGLPAALRGANLGSGPIFRVASLGELWGAYGRSGDGLMVVQPDMSEAEHAIALVTGQQVEVLGFDPLSDRYRPAPPELVEPVLGACRKLVERHDFTLTGLEFAWHRNKLWLSDLHLVPDLEWWSLGEEAFSRVVANCAEELIGRTAPPKKTKAKKTRNQ